MEWSHIRKIKNHFYQQRVTKFPLYFSFAFHMSTHKKVDSRKVHTEKLLPAVFIHLFPNLRNCELESYVCRKRDSKSLIISP